MIHLDISLLETSVQVFQGMNATSVNVSNSCNKDMTNPKYIEKLNLEDLIAKTWHKVAYVTFQLSNTE